MKTNIINSAAEVLRQKEVPSVIVGMIADENKNPAVAVEEQVSKLNRRNGRKLTKKYSLTLSCFEYEIQLKLHLLG